MEIVINQIPFIFDVATAFFQLLIVTYCTRCHSSKLKFLVMPLILMASYTVINNVMSFITVQFVFMYVYILLFAMLFTILFNVRLNKSFPLALCVTVCSTILDLIVIVILAFIQSDSPVISEVRATVDLTLIVIKILVLISWVWLYVIIKPYSNSIKDIIDNNPLVRTLGSCLAMLLLMIIPVTSDYITLTAIEDISIIIYYLIIICVILWVSVNLLKNTDSNNRISRQYEINQKNVEVLEASLQKSSSYRHDWHNHMASINAFIDLNQYERLQQYVQNMSADLSIVSSTVSISEKLKTIPPLYGILVYKLVEAEAKAIKLNLEANINDDAKSRFSDKDFSVVFGVLMDNAFEAVQECPDKYVYIRIIYNKHLEIEIRNPYIGEVDVNAITEDGFSTKQGHTGFGLHGVNQIIRRYRKDDVDVGVYYDTDNGTFIAMINA